MIGNLNVLSLLFVAAGITMIVASRKNAEAHSWGFVGWLLVAVFGPCAAADLFLFVSAK